MEKVKSYLEFGYKKGNIKVPYDTKEEQDAYDFFMVARYLKDIIAYRTGKIEEIHHKEDMQDNLKKYVALTVCKGLSSPLVFYEIGSSLMGVIDSLEYINKELGVLNVKHIKFVGVDNSKMMNTVASYLHPSYKLELSEEKLMINCDLFFAKGISILYAFEEEELLCNILKKSKIAIFDYTFSLKDEPIKDVMVSGKMGVHLSLNKCKKMLDEGTKKLFLLPSKRDFKISDDRKLYECVYGEEKLVEQYLKELKIKEQQLNI